VCVAIATRQVPLVEEELVALSQHLSSPPIRVARAFVDRYVLFILTIVLKVLLRFTYCDCFFGIYKLFLGTAKCGELYNTQCIYC